MPNDVPGFLTLLAALALLPPACRASAPVITAVGPHSRTWRWVDAAGATNSMVELQTGLYYADPTGQWQESRERIQPTPTGAAALEGQHRVQFPGDLAGNWVETDTADGQVLRSQVYGLAYYDAASGRMVMIGQLQSTLGQLIASNQILFPNAFTNGPRASIRYTYRRSGLEQDVILEQQPPPPGAWGFPEATTRLLVLTEFDNPPNPAIEPRYLYHEADPAVRRRMAAPDFIDESISFGWMGFGRGMALDLSGGLAGAVPVGKLWSVRNGRTFLIEAIQYPALKPLLAKLGAGSGAGAWLRTRPAPRQRLLETLPRRAERPVVRSVVREASASGGGQRPDLGEAPGVVLDWVLLNGATNFTFKGDTTYYVSGLVNLSQTTTLEGGTVVKFTNNTSSAYIDLQGAVNCLASPYRPCVFTSKDDNSVGEILPGSTGNPGTGYYGYGLELAQSATLSYLRFANAFHALTLDAGVALNLDDSQFVQCANPFYQNCTPSTPTTTTVWNGLFASTGTLTDGGPSAFTGVNVTLDRCATVANDIYGSAVSSLNLTNALLAGVQSWGTYATTNLDSTVAAPQSFGDYSSYGQPTEATVFRTVGAGSHYLAPNSPYRNVGTASIDPALLNSLRQQTTYAPVLLLSDFTQTTTLSPVIHRDVDTPDLGYHYDPLDYVWSGLNLTNTTLTLANGVAVGVYGSRGLVLRNGANLVGAGLPQALSQLVPYTAVQENPLIWGDAPLATVLAMTSQPSPLPTIQLSFTDLSLMANSVAHRYLLSPGYAFNSFSAFASQLRGIATDIYDDSYNTGGAMTIALTNCLVQNAYLDFYQDSIPGYYLFTVDLYNNLFQEGTLALVYDSPYATWTARDNLLDRVYILTGNYCVNNSHNGYYDTTALCGSGGGDVTLHATDYEAGLLGATYYPTTGTNLANLIDAGSRTASQAGLSSFTTTTNQSPDTGTVDIGFHYPALPWSPAVNIAATQPIAVNYGGGSITYGTFTLTRQGSTTSGLAVYFSVAGTAVVNVNYTLTDPNGNTVTSPVTIPAGQSSLALTVNPLDEGAFDYTKTLVLTLQPSGDSYYVSQPTQATVYIENNDDSLVGVSPVVSGLNLPIGVDYYAPSNALIVSLNYQSGSPYNFLLIDSNTNQSQWSSTSGFTDEIHHAIPRATTNGFTLGELYFGLGTNMPGVVGKISADGLTVTTNWAVLSGETNGIQTVALDQAGVFGGDLLAVTEGNETTGAAAYGGDVWKISSSGGGTRLTSLGSLLEAAVTIPNDPVTYGPWAGTLLTGSEQPSLLLYTVSPNGQWVAYEATNGVPTVYFIRLTEPDAAALVPAAPAGQYLYCINPAPNLGNVPAGELVQVTGIDWARFAADIVVVNEPPASGTSSLLFFHWDGNDFNIRQTGGLTDGNPYGFELEGLTFAPLNLP